MSDIDVIVERTILAAREASLELKFGRVKSLKGRTAVITLDGVDVPSVPVMASYNAKAGDLAWLLQQGSTLIAIGCTKAGG